MVEYFDISVPTSARTTVFPGDAPPRFYSPGWTLERGNPASVGFFEGGLHHGTYVDAPCHFIRGGRTMHEMPLDRWLGPCWVADLTAEKKCVFSEALDRANVPSDMLSMESMAKSELLPRRVVAIVGPMRWISGKSIQSIISW